MSSPSSQSASTRVLLAGCADWTESLAEQLSVQGETSVRTVTGVRATMEAVRAQPIDCVVTGVELDDGTGIELIGAIREEIDALPVVMCTARGSEAVASDAIAAGVSEYVALDDAATVASDTVAGIRELIEESVRTAELTAARRTRARQFDAICDDAHAATWVLDPDGSLVRANDRARDVIDDAVEPLLGEPFWTLPWWTGESGVQRDVRQLVETAVAGELGQAVLTRSEDAPGPQVIEFSARPVRASADDGEIVSIVVEGVDITERVGLERDLRRSEELHRVTLNNMTDTVLITDESGSYTYVCPNVHFIFGYTAEEIRDRGTIEDLLGEDLFAREELADAGVLKNIECTATDKAGREHTLLVNVREVSIQDGTLLYSCRDITKRKQREEALATLQETARDFLYAETHEEIAQHVVDDTPGVFDLEASAVYLIDADENDLRPAASTAAMEAVNGPLPTVGVDGEALPSYSFVEDEPLFLDDVHGDERLSNPATDLRSAAYIPLGDHGVFVAGSPGVGEFDAVTRELADLLAATAEAALDRVSRESRLREQDRELQRRNDQLSVLNRINETIREIDQALVRAETREDVDHAVCGLLTDDDRFAFAWIGDADPGAERVEPRAWAGDEQGYLDSLPFSIEPTGTEPAGRTAATKTMTMEANVVDGLREETWRKHAVTRDYLSVLSIPLVYNDITYGVLTVYAGTRDAFDETARAVLAELGETIAAAISAIERKNALLTTSMTRVEFAVEDRSFVLSRLAQDAACTVSYQGGVQQSADGVAVFVTVQDAPVEAVEAAANDLVAVDDVQRVSSDEQGGVLRLELSQPFLALELADHGAILRGASATPTSTTLVVDVPESVAVRHVTELADETFAAVDLRSKQPIDGGGERDLYSRFIEALTDRQLEVIQTAYYSGFFESPRESTGEEVAETLGVSPAAFYQHARTVQRKLFSALFDESSVRNSVAPGGVE